MQNKTFWKPNLLIEQTEAHILQQTTTSSRSSTGRNSNTTAGRNGSQLLPTRSNHRSENLFQVLGSRAGVATKNGEQVSGDNLHFLFGGGAERN
ncbi:hypothetical protein OIU77_029200 [Salix suchowensis]|uniref:Uncharacterized protein n=1 Tax=Salix suchowensis TaxID=1278906 RepID=A0ABQ9BMG1_9ROSI|nr:hypothetical protein OIU77_029200 [Salix suchowensis]